MKTHDEKKALQAEVDALGKRRRQTEEELLASRARGPEAESALADAGANGDDETAAKLTKELVELPGLIHAIEIKLQGIVKAHERKSAELGKINLAERQEKLTKDRAALDVVAAEVVGEVSQGMETLGLALAKYDRLAEQAASIQAQLATLGQASALLPRWTDVVEGRLAAFRGRYADTRNVLIPVINA